MPFDNLVIERDDAVAVLTISRPKVLDALNNGTTAFLEKRQPTFEGR